MAVTEMTVSARCRPAAALAVVAILAGLALGACDDNRGVSSSPTTSASGKGTTTVTPSPPPEPTFSPKPLPTSKPSSSPATLRGRVEEGVEAGCLMLNDGGMLYQLVGGDRSLLRPGRTVEVTGTVEPDLATTCQQGRPFVVRQTRVV